MIVRLFRKRAEFLVSEKGDEPGPDVERTSLIREVSLLDSLTSLLAPAALGQPPSSPLKGKIVLFGMDDNPETFFNAIRLGAVGYLLNDAASEDVIVAVRRVAEGAAVCPPSLCLALFEYVSRELNRKAYLNDPASGPMNGLTLRQRQLMALVAKGMTNKEIAAILNLSEFTVRNHIHRVLKHVEVDSRREAVDLMRDSGLLPVA
jgi:DNA-binding NarL/FixJ family response regulator